MRLDKRLLDERRTIARARRIRSYLGATYGVVLAWFHFDVGCSHIWNRNVAQATARALTFGKKENGATFQAKSQNAIRLIVAKHPAASSGFANSTSCHHYREPSETRAST